MKWYKVVELERRNLSNFLLSCVGGRAYCCYIMSSWPAFNSPAGWLAVGLRWWNWKVCFQSPPLQEGDRQQCRISTFHGIVQGFRSWFRIIVSSSQYQSTAPFDDQVKWVFGCRLPLPLSSRLILSFSCVSSVYCLAPSMTTFDRN